MEVPFLPELITLNQWKLFAETPEAREEARQIQVELRTRFSLVGPQGVVPHAAAEGVEG